MADSPTPAVTEYTKLLSLAVHEMRTPASVVVGYLRMLLNDTTAPLGERHRRMLSEAEKACGRLVDMLSEMSDVGKLDAGTAVIAQDRFDLFELVRSVAGDLDEPLDREVGLRTTGDAAAAPFDGDRARMSAALRVVIRAVVREQPASSTVIVDTRRVTFEDRPFARIVVAPEPDLARAAETIPTELDDRRGGLGLGLPLAKRVIARYDGRIWSPATPADRESRPVGARGAIVVLLPVSS